jgi:prepilin-type N-terminal cleavage/methylation domain-containing protein
MRHGFTLIELLVVVALVLLLMGLLIPGVALLRSRAKIASSEKALQTIAQAVSRYLADHRAIGSSAGLIDGTTVDLADALTTEIKGVSYLERDSSMFAPAGGLIDAFREPIRWCAVNETRYQRVYTKAFIVLSTSGTPEQTADDVMLELDLANGSWLRKAYDARTDTAWIPR